ncbi:hypothetical protein [Prosthecobacter sp.]
MSLTSESVSFRSRPSPVAMVLCGLFFGLAAVFFVSRAQTNEQGLILNGLIHFSPGGASVFYAVLGGVSALFVVVAVWATFNILVHGVPDVVVGPESVTFPRGVKKSVTLPWAEIDSLSRGNVNGQHFLTLHAAGKKHSISLNWLESDEARAQLEAAIVQRLSSKQN